jgi:hypothetical protein
MLTEQAMATKHKKCKRKQQSGEGNSQRSVTRIKELPFVTLVMLKTQPILCYAILTLTKGYEYLMFNKIVHITYMPFSSFRSTVIT